MNIAIDIDGTIDEHPEFFAFLSSSLRSQGHRVVILTYRGLDSAERTREQLAAWRIAFDDLVFARSLADKGRLCREHEIDLFFDDQDECVVEISSRTLVLKIRNEGNFDFETKRWLSTCRLTRLL